MIVALDDPQDAVWEGGAEDYPRWGTRWLRLLEELSAVFRELVFGAGLYIGLSCSSFNWLLRGEDLCIT